MKRLIVYLALAAALAGQTFDSHNAYKIRGTPVSMYKKGTITATAFTDFSVTAVQVQTFTITGLAVGDSVLISPRTQLIFGTGPVTGLVWHAYCSATNTLTVRFWDPGNGGNNGLIGLTPIFDYLIFR